jgi:thiosulfate/3-mercaptopyruvate sulfurtransferase
MVRRAGWLGVLLGALAFAPPPAVAQPRRDLLIETGELAARLAKGGSTLIDAEPGEAYARAHIPGAVNLHYMDLEDAEENAKSGRPVFPQMAANKFGDLGVAANTEVIVYDSGNGRGASALWYILKYIGHERVQVVDGGFRKWVKEGRPVSQDEAKRSKARYVLHTPRADWALTTEQVRTGKAVLVDARSLAEFAGKESGGARQAGHIPGAISFPWDKLADRIATFKDESAMRKALATAGLTPEKQIVTYCNPGLGRSTYLLLALSLLGYDKVKVYPGSYLEWAADPGRPIAR